MKNTKTLDDESSSTDRNAEERIRWSIDPVRDYEEGQVIESLFYGKRHCWFLFTVWIPFDDILREYFLKLCSVQRSCQSILFKESNIDVGKCQLNTETVHDVPSSYFTWNDENSKSWDYYDRIPDYFLIFNKETGEIINGIDKTT